MPAGSLGAAQDLRAAIERHNAIPFMLHECVVTAEQATAARLTVCDVLGNASAARDVLAALALLPPPPAPAPTPDRPRRPRAEWDRPPTPTEMNETHAWMLANGYMRPVQRGAR